MKDYQHGVVSIAYGHAHPGEALSGCQSAIVKVCNDRKLEVISVDHSWIHFNEQYICTAFVCFIKDIGGDDFNGDDNEYDPDSWKTGRMTAGLGKPG